MAALVRVAQHLRARILQLHLLDDLHELRARRHGLALARRAAQGHVRDVALGEVGRLQLRTLERVRVDGRARRRRLGAAGRLERVTLGRRPGGSRRPGDTRRARGRRGGRGRGRRGGGRRLRARRARLREGRLGHRVRRLRWGGRRLGRLGEAGLEALHRGLRRGRTARGASILAHTDASR
ncbi:hypothetical protein D7Y27_35140 [Corallococcus sp. AB004]|nr:hypothetical protein D7Y04_25930 [Corallococcus sp. AB038B]RKI33123.1 hypothetical protein D7Y27_35140 [Corallococcus sp. AB004]